MVCSATKCVVALLPTLHMHGTKQWLFPLQPVCNTQIGVYAPCTWKLCASRLLLVAYDAVPACQGASSVSVTGILACSCAVQLVAAPDMKVAAAAPAQAQPAMAEAMGAGGGAAAPGIDEDLQVRGIVLPSTWLFDLLTANQPRCGDDLPSPSHIVVPAALLGCNFITFLRVACLVQAHVHSANCPQQQLHLCLKTLIIAVGKQVTVMFKSWCCCCAKILCLLLLTACLKQVADISLC